MLRLLYVYRFVTFGGVERVLLNRAEAFREYGVQVRMSLYCLEDLGALDSLRRYIDTAGLSEYITVVKGVHEDEYDFIISIDTPEILKYGIKSSKLLFECHSTYIRDRVYLARLPETLRLIAVPSNTLKAALELERPELAGKIVVVRNYVKDFSARHGTIETFWQKRPLLYLGRMDEHKNICEVMDLFAFYRDRYDDELMLVLAGAVSESIDLQKELHQRHLADRTVILPPVSFERTNMVFSLVKAHKGVFISSSIDEASPLSVAEAITYGLPVLLSGIKAHAAAVNHDLNFLYPLGNLADGADKLRSIVSNYDEMQKTVVSWKERFSVKAFIEDWNCFTELLSVAAQPVCEKESSYGKS